MPFPPSVRCAIFDLDGTLLDSLEDLADSANAMLRACGYPVHDTSQYRHFVGDGALALVQRILPEPIRCDEALVKQHLEHFTREYKERWNRKTRPYDGIAELLQGLASREIALAVLSNKPHAFTVQCIHTFCPAPPGSEWAAIFGYREDVPKKPHPAGVHEILARLHIAPGDTVYFGDTSTDMMTAVAAGVYPIGVLWGFRARRELEESGAQTLLAHPRDLLPLLPPIGKIRN